MRRTQVPRTAERSIHPKGRLLKLREVLEVTGRSRSSIYRDIDRGTFPVPLRTGPNSLAWWEADIVEWLNALRPKRPEV